MACLKIKTHQNIHLKISHTNTYIYIYIYIVAFWFVRACNIK